MKAEATTGQNWSSRIAFILATVGFSVGLGNIWRFPYLAGESGGGAFVLVYVLCVLLIGIPIVMAELAIGRRGGHTPARSMLELAKTEGRSPAWRLAGYLAIGTAFLILSYYCVIGGWTLHYVTLSASGSLGAVSSDQSTGLFDDLLASPLMLIVWQTVFLGLNALVVSRGLKGGIERAVSILMPLLFLLLVTLAIYGLIAGDAARGLTFLFQPDFSQITSQTFLDAMGQAFFSVGVGMAAMMTYGSYLPKTVRIPRTSAIIAFADTGVAIIAGIAIFPFVFAFGLSPTEGPGLVFVTMPAAFAETGSGSIVSFGFFTLLAVAALTSSIALFEVLVAWGEERGIARKKTAIIAALLCWLVGLLTVFSFNEMSEFYPAAFIPGFAEATAFDVMDKLTATIGLPLGGLAVAIFAGHVLSKQHIAEELGFGTDNSLFKVWRFLVRWPLPAIIALLIIAGVQA